MAEHAEKYHDKINLELRNAHMLATDKKDITAQKIKMREIHKPSSF
jgi:hypothetical protein